MKEINREELAWAGGLFEGEGCFSTQGPTGIHGRTGCRATLIMADRDIVERFAQAVAPIGYIAKKGQLRPSGELTVWVVSTFEGVQALLALLWPWLGPRRRARAKDLLAIANLPKGRPWERLKGDRCVV